MGVMEERVLKWISILSVILATVVSISLQFFPQMHEKSVLAAERRAKLLDRGSEQVAQVIQEEEHEELLEDEEALEIDAQLKIELPEQNTSDTIKIENDYLNQVVYIRFKGGVEDYFLEYGMSGSSDHIASLSYYKEKEDGVIVLGLDTVYELEQEYQAGNLYLDFHRPQEIYDKVIVVDAGHGGRAVGAVKREVQEKNLNLSIVKELKALFDKDDRKIGVYYTRMDDSNPTLDQRVQLANKTQANLFVSVHNNAASTGGFSGLNGTEVLYSESDNSTLSSKKFAMLCADMVSKTAGSRNLGLVKGDRIYIVRTSEVPVALVEGGYMTNKEELENLMTQDYQKKIAEGIYQAINEAFEEGY